MTNDTTTATYVPPGWRHHAERLAGELVASGDIQDTAWAAAINAVPRHLLVPDYYLQRPDGTWTRHNTAREGLELAYSTTTLVTQVAGGRAVSSSTKPDLMARMLEQLDVRDGQRVLEIGTGTGYNIALLSHRLGDQAVSSLDIDQQLIDAARRRLAAIGYRPHLRVGDGIDGWPGRAPYDRIIATCSVPAIPWSWARQLTPGGLLLADLKLGPGAGNLVALRRHADRLEGRFTGRWAAFMSMRHHPATAPAPRAGKAAAGTQRLTKISARPWDTDREAWMLACLRLPASLVQGYTLDPDTRSPRAATLSADDGSWCEVDLADDGHHRIREAGPTPLWSQVEEAFTTWRALGEPTWQCFGLTVTEHACQLWVHDRADHRHLLRETAHDPRTR